MSLSTEQIVQQSNNAFRQWGPQWEEHCKQHATNHPEDIKKSLEHFANSGVGRALLLIANGQSFEREIETIKKYQKHVDIMVCDKTLGNALDHGITPTYAVVCDANVKFEKYMEPWKDRLQDTIVFQNVCANPKWVDNGNWKERYFFVNVDVIKSEVKWQGLTGCPNLIAAGTNVSNAMVVFATQSDNDGRKNFFGYDKILLIGFDYCWTQEGGYYAFDAEAAGKANYMRHQYVRTMGGELAYTSNNLVFSSKWLDKYIQAFRLPVVQCTKHTIFHAAKMGVLSDHMQYSFREEDSAVVKRVIQERDKAMESVKNLDKVLKRIGREHFFAFMAS